MSKLFVVSCCCIPETDAILLEFLLSVLEKQTDAEWKLTYDLDGDITVIDTDSEDGQNLYQKTLSQNDQDTVIQLTSDVEKTNSDNSVLKPMRSAEFMSVINKILKQYPDLARETTELAEAPTARSNAVDEVVKSEPIPSVIKRPTVRRLYNLLTEDAANYKKPVELIYREVSIYINFSAKQLFCEHKLMLLSMLSKADVNNIEIRELNDFDFIKIERSIRPRPLSELIWCCTLLGSSGELVPSIDQNTRLHLKRWPNLKSLVHLPRHITLTAFLTKYTATLAEVSSQTRIPAEHVIDFINACSVMGFIDQREQTNSETKVIEKDTVKHGLFGKIRNKFGMKA